MFNWYYEFWQSLVILSTFFMQSIEQQSSQPLLESASDPLQKWWVMLGIGIGMSLFSLDMHIVNIALPTLVRELHTNLSTVEWVSLSYLLMLTVLVLSVGQLGDMWGKKWLYFGGLILFTFSSLLCGLAPTIEYLIAFRVIQGFSAAFICALAPAIITEVFPKEQRGLALGISTGIAWLGTALGPTLGGLLIGFGSWRLIFLVNLPFCILAGLLVLFFVPDSTKSEAEQSFDTLGTLLMIVTLTCFVLGITKLQSEEFGDTNTLIFLVVAALGLGSFLVSQTRIAKPMLNLEMFRSLELSLGLLLSSIAYAFTIGLLFILPFFLELVKHYPEQQVGLMLALLPVVSVLMAPVAGYLSDRIGERIVSIIGLVLLVFGCLAISTFDAELTVWGYILRVTPVALGVGIFQPSNQSAVMGSISPERLGIGSGLLFLSRTLGQITGLSLIGILFSILTYTHTQVKSPIDVTDAPVEALVFAMQMSFRLIAPILIAATIFAVVLWWLEGRKQRSYE
jgi:EmrB/QacA subfamily drug resistance transporter